MLVVNERSPQIGLNLALRKFTLARRYVPRKVATQCRPGHLTFNTLPEWHSHLDIPCSSFSRLLPVQDILLFFFLYIDTALTYHTITKLRTPLNILKTINIWAMFNPHHHRRVFKTVHLTEMYSFWKSGKYGWLGTVTS